MITYLDSSVIVRRVLDEPGHELDWSQIDETASSSLAEVECFRALDRLRLIHAIDDVAHARLREQMFRAFETCEILEVSRAVFERAAMPFPTILRTLDALHLATILLYREAKGTPVRMATHDRALARACRAMGVEAIGAA